MDKTMTKKRAVQLTAEIRHNLLTADKALREFIAGRGWIALGCESFAEWFRDNLADITLAVELRIDVVYQLLAEGQTPEQAAKDVKGLGPDTVANIDRQRKNGVPASRVRTGRRQGGRRAGSGRPATHLYLDLGAQMCAQLAEIAATYGQSKEEVAIEFINDGIAKWLPSVRKSA